MGPTERGGETDASGQVNFPGLQAGTYRLRFSGDKVTTFEKEVVVRARAGLGCGRVAQPGTGAKGDHAAGTSQRLRRRSRGRVPRASRSPTRSVICSRKSSSGKQPRRETLLSCSGNERAAMIQLNEPMPERLYENADAIYYVLGGEGTLMVNGKETTLGLERVCIRPARHVTQLLEARESAARAALRAERRALRRGTLTRSRPCAVGVEREADEVRRLIGAQQQRREHEHHRVAAV